MSREYRDLIAANVDLEEKGGGLMPRGGSARMFRKLNGRGGRNTSHITMARQLAYRSGLDTRRTGPTGMTMVPGKRIRAPRR